MQESSMRGEVRFQEIEYAAVVKQAVLFAMDAMGFLLQEHRFRRFTHTLHRSLHQTRMLE